MGVIDRKDNTTVPRLQRGYTNNRLLRSEDRYVSRVPRRGCAPWAAVHPSDLARQTILVPEPGSYRTLFEQSLASAGIPYEKTEFTSIEAIKQCLMAVQKELPRGLLQSLSWVGPPFPIETQLCRHQHKWLSPALEAFIGMAKNNIPRQQADQPWLNWVSAPPQACSAPPAATAKTPSQPRQQSYR